MTSRTLAILSLVASLGAPASAFAVDRSQMFVGLGAGLTMGEGRARLTGHLQLAAARALSDAELTPTVGGFSRFRFYKGGSDFTIGGLGGAALTRLADEREMEPLRYYPRAFTQAELGLTLRWHGGSGLSGGLAAGGFNLFSVSGGGLLDLAGEGRGDFVETRIDGGLYVPSLSTTIVIEGRPLREGDRIVRAPILRGGDDAAARPWAEEGRDEYASVAAFLRLARELAALGAPPALVARARAAADDEIVHARLCFGMAEARDGGPLFTARIAAPTRCFASRRHALARLAVESLQDGALGEGAAAERARAASEGARDPVVAEVKALIADDESRHAALGRDLVAWCVREGGAAVRSVVTAAERAAA